MKGLRWLRGFFCFLLSQTNVRNKMIFSFLLSPLFLLPILKFLCFSHLVIENLEKEKPFVLLTFSFPLCLNCSYYITHLCLLLYQFLLLWIHNMKELIGFSRWVKMSLDTCLPIYWNRTMSITQACVLMQMQGLR